MDMRLAKEGYIFFNAGTHRDAIHMSVPDYVRVADPLVLQFAHPDRLGASQAQACGVNDATFQTHTLSG